MCTDVFRWLVSGWFHDKCMTNDKLVAFLTEPDADANADNDDDDVIDLLDDDE